VKSITGIAILIKFLMIIFSKKKREGEKVACPLYSGRRKSSLSPLFSNFS